MYFAILGKTPLLSLVELELVHPSSVIRRGSIVFFKTDHEDILSQLAGITKRGKIISQDDFGEVVGDKELVGTNSKTIGMRCKKLHGAKRFKIVEMDRADLDVKKEGVEIIELEDMYGHVLGRQPIDLFAAIDFDKPGRGMQIGMMPAKLTQILLNIGIRYAIKESEIKTVYDPFCGFGTTLFVANSLAYHAIGSDINSTLAKKNIQRWPTTEYAHEERYLTLFRHDVHDAFSKTFLNAVDCIVTEGWLGPVVKSQNTENKGQHAIIMKNIEEIVTVYRGFLSNTKDFFTDTPIVMTVPVYDRLGDVIEQRITVYAEHMGYTATPLGEVYQRKKQTVGRRVLLIR